MKEAERKVAEADELVKKRRHEEARIAYEQVAALFYDMRDAQWDDMPGQGVSLSGRLLLVNRYLLIPMDRLGELHMKLGNAKQAAICFRASVDAMEQAVRNAGGDTRTEFESIIATQRRKLADAEKISGPTKLEEGLYTRRHQKIMKAISSMSRLPGEATLLLARRILQLPIAMVTQDDVRSALGAVNDLSATSLSEAQLVEVREAHGPRIRALATELAAVRRDHPLLA